MQVNTGGRVIDALADFAHGHCINAFSHKLLAGSINNQSAKLLAFDFCFRVWWQIKLLKKIRFETITFIALFFRNNEQTRHNQHCADSGLQGNSFFKQPPS